MLLAPGSSFCPFFLAMLRLYLLMLRTILSLAMLPGLPDSRVTAWAWRCPASSSRDSTGLMLTLVTVLWWGTCQTLHMRTQMSSEFQYSIFSIFGLELNFRGTLQTNQGKYEFMIFSNQNKNIKYVDVVFRSLPFRDNTPQYQMSCKTSFFEFPCS